MLNTAIVEKLKTKALVVHAGTFTGEKTFTNFAALLPSAKVFSANFMHIRGSPGMRSGQFASIFSPKCYIFTNSRKFSPANVSGHAFIECMYSAASECEDGQVRLVDGLYESGGRVEVCFDQQYGTVCDRGFDGLDATVICRQLGFSDGADGK